MRCSWALIGGAAGWLLLAAPAAGAKVEAGVAQPRPYTEELVTSLVQVAKRLEAEHDAAQALANAREQACTDKLDEFGAPKTSIRAGAALVKKAKIDLQSAQADMAAVQSNIDSLTNKIAESRRHVNELTYRLRVLRDEQKRREGRAAATLQQLDSVIVQAQHEEERHRPSGGGEDSAKLTTEVSDLRRLGQQLLSSASVPAAFLQTGASQTNVGGLTVGSLENDRRTLLHSRRVTSGDFAHEEARLIELIKLQRAAQLKLEDDLANQRPLFADKNKQAAEADRTIGMADRALTRDMEELAITQITCKLQADGATKMNQLRDNLIGLVKMPAVLLERLDTAAFISRDLRDFPSFVQLGSMAKTSLGQAVRDALKAAAGAEASVLGTDGAADADADSADSADSADAASADVDADAADADAESGAASGGALAMAQQGATSGARGGAAAAGPFDQVTAMIRSLMASIRNQANQDTNLHQWCTDSTNENDRDRVEAKRLDNMAAMAMLWAQAGITNLDQQIAYFQSETERLRREEQQVWARRSNETSMLNNMKAAHQEMRAVFVRALQVLQGKCGLPQLFHQILNPPQQFGASQNWVNREVRVSGQGQEDIVRTVGWYEVYPFGVQQGHQLALLAQADGGLTSAEGPVTVETRGATLLQRDRGAQRMPMTRTSNQCAEAANIIVQAGLKLNELDIAINMYQAMFLQAMVLQGQSFFQNNYNQRVRDLQNAQAARARRAHDLATAEGDRRRKQTDLQLIEQAARAIEQKCSVQETDEERMAARREEIEGLRSALRVLNGEDIPVGSFLSTGARR